MIAIMMITVPELSPAEAVEDGTDAKVEETEGAAVLAGADVLVAEVVLAATAVLETGMLVSGAKELETGAVEATTEDVTAGAEGCVAVGFGVLEVVGAGFTVFVYPHSVQTPSS